MLAVTEAAADAISALTAQDGLAGQGGLRFTLVTPEVDGAPIAVALAQEPVAGDQVVRATAGAQVFLEPGAAELLSDKVLDVQQDAEGQLNFAVLEQRDTPPAM
ncbi:iron-sulfur cluster biosynthesis protein [Actinokineospora iranica]|uniref:Fe-S cluster assembly iron-binding protein IscA n=1 Tax=Actinokineospora iranica TaxID=1271860 RepID=A0A1G6K6A8_9PSEU|nr:iron-sulfur cluster biosynthesis protein [Actinokineospora iranica]SDC26463.1 Fe-S cluster assembly iron-binding protein IscA [Actinokineospora iranica]